MNPFAALESDDDEDFTVVKTNKKTDTKKKPVAAKAPVAAPVETQGPASDKKSSRGGAARGKTFTRGAGRGGKETGDRRNGKREFDRRSGTGRGNEVTKGGAGKGGWGNNKDEVKEGQDEVEAEKNGDNTVEEEVVEVQEPAEPEVPTYTLDEYLAQRNATKPLGSVFSAVEERKVEDVKLKQGDYDLPNFLKLGTSKQKSNAEKNQRATSKTSISDVGFHAAPKEQEERGGKGGRGGRGAARNAPRAGRGASRGQAKVDINDSSAFPKL